MSSLRFTKATLASTVLCLSSIVSAAPLNINTANNNLATINVDPGAAVTVNETITFGNNGAVLTTGAPAFTVTVTNANAAIPVNFNINNTTQAIEIQSDQQAILLNGAAKTLTGVNSGMFVNIAKDAIVQTTGNKAVLDFSPTNVLATATVTVNNSGSIINTNATSDVLNRALLTSEFVNIIINNQGTIQGGLGAIAIDIDDTKSANVITNSGSIVSNGSKAISASAGVSTFATTLTQTAGLIQGKSQVIDFTGQVSPVTLSGGSVIATDGVFGDAISTAGAININGAGVAVTGVMRSTALVDAGININPGLNNSFTTNGALDANSATGNVLVSSGTLNLRHDIVTTAVGGGNLKIQSNGNVNLINNRTIGGSINMLQPGSKATFVLSDSNLAAVATLSANSFGQINSLAGVSDLSGAQISVVNTGDGYIANNTNFAIIKGAVAYTKGGVVVNVPNGTGIAPMTGSTGVYTYNTVFNANDITINVTRKPLNTFGDYNSLPLVSGVGDALEVIGKASNAIGAVNNASMMRLIAEIGRLPDANSVVNALSQLVPPTNHMTMQSTIDATNHAHKTIENRISGLRMSENDESDRGYNAGHSDSEPAVWGQFFGSHANQKRNKTVFGYKSDLFGLSIGTDKRASDELRIGAALSYAAGTAKSQRLPRSSDKTKMYQLTAYGSYDMGCGWFEGMMSYANIKHTGVRNFVVGAISGTALNNHHGFEWAGRLGYGYPLYTDNGWDVLPMARVIWHHINERGYSERGAPPFDLTLNNHNVDFLNAGIDSKWVYPMLVETGKLLPYFNVGINFDVSTTREQNTARFTSGGPSFKVRGPQKGRFGANWGIGASLLTQKSVSFEVNYEGKYQKRYVASTGFVHVRYAL